MGGDGEERALTLAPSVIVVTPEMVEDLDERRTGDVWIIETWTNGDVEYEIRPVDVSSWITPQTPHIEESFNEWVARTARRST